MKIKFLLFLLLVGTTLAQTTGLRWDLGGPIAGVSSTTSVSGTNYVTTLSGVKLNWCQYPANSTQGTPCTNFATTYTDLTLGTSCPSNQSITLSNSNVCTGTSDEYGNLGVNTAYPGPSAQAGYYTYTLTFGSTTYGPFVVTLGGAGGGGGGGITGSGTAPKFPIWTATTGLGNSNLQAVASPNGVQYSTAVSQFWQLDSTGLYFNSGVAGSGNILIQNTFNPGANNNAGGIVIEGAPTTGSACAGSASLVGNGTNGAGNGADVIAGGGCSNGFGAVGADIVVQAGSTTASNR